MICRLYITVPVKVVIVSTVKELAVVNPDDSLTALMSVFTLEVNEVNY